MSKSTKVGISARIAMPDLSDFAAILDDIESLGVESIELPAYDMDLVVGGRICKPQLAVVKAATTGRKVDWTVHGPLSINFMDEAYRLPRHFDVLTASVEAAAELGAAVYVLHTGHVPCQDASGIEAAYARQRDWFAKAGSLAKAHGLTICVENLFDWTWGKLHTAPASRLARELAAVGHPHIRATVDFSHAYLETGCRGGTFLDEIKPLTAMAGHLHIHDSFGRADDIYMYTDGERLAHGHGDLHLPVGWGDLPWADVMAHCRFAEGTVFNIELNPRFWHTAKACVAAVREIAVMAKLG